MCRLVQYGHYVDSLEEQEEAPFCTECATNRKILEHAWQVVANEFYDPYGRFNQAEWASKLQQTLERHGGAFCVCARRASASSFPRVGTTLRTPSQARSRARASCTRRRGR